MAVIALCVCNVLQFGINVRVRARLNQLETKVPTPQQLAQRVTEQLSRKADDTPETVNGRAAKYLFSAGWSVDDVAKAFEVDPAEVETWQNEGRADA
ncbi:Uncharacterised protein [Brevundimonas diminuta]|jgi:hypothetical protein|nr:hypothetical protein [Brevundimonas diminuta]SPU47984.1 Uncharacterised protein [Brevundimonas diminuta]SUW15812.1 Uncharacterised protein [Brevundimonas diminuta]